MSARDELRVMLSAAGHWPGPIEQRLDAYRAEVLAEAADVAKDIGLGLIREHKVERSNGAYDVMTALHRKAREAGGRDDS